MQDTVKRSIEFINNKIRDMILKVLPNDKNLNDYELALKFKSIGGEVEQEEITYSNNFDKHIYYTLKMFGSPRYFFIEKIHFNNMELKQIIEYTEIIKVEGK